MRTSPEHLGPSEPPLAEWRSSQRARPQDAPRPRCPQFSFCTTTATTARLEGGEGAGPSGGGTRGGDKEAEECVGKCSSASPSSIPTQVLLGRFGLQLPGVCGAEREVHAQWAPHGILSAEEGVMSPASW